MEDIVIFSSRKKATRYGFLLIFAAALLIFIEYVMYIHGDIHSHREIGILSLAGASLIYVGSALYICIYAIFNPGKLTVSTNGIELQLSGVTRILEWDQMREPRLKLPFSIILGKAKFPSGVPFISDLWTLPLGEIFRSINDMRQLNGASLDNTAVAKEWVSITQCVAYPVFFVDILGFSLLLLK